jgi:hypothetical protein
VLPEQISRHWLLDYWKWYWISSEVLLCSQRVIGLLDISQLRA